MFNKSVEVHSKKVFPPNVVVKTANALSYAYIIRTHGPKEKTFKHGNLSYWQLIENGLLPFREVGSFPGFSLYHRAAMVFDTLNHFYNSSNDEV